MSRQPKFVSVAIALVFAMLATGFGPSRVVPKDQGFQKGFTYLKWGSQFIDHADRSFSTLKETGANWVAFVPMYYQDGLKALEIYPHPVLSPTDDELLAAIARAKAMGFKIMLKPHVDVIHDFWKAELPKGKDAWLTQYRRFIDNNPIIHSAPDGDDLDPASVPPGDAGLTLARKNWFRQMFEWRGYINAGSDAKVKKWFESYTRYIVHMARLAEAADVDQFCVGTELEDVKRYTPEWRKVIKEVRSVFSGPILYDTNLNSYAEIGFWDRLDYIGLSAYFPVAANLNPSETEIRITLNSWLQGLESYLTKMTTEYGRAFQVLFSEAGYTDFKGTTRMPWDFLLTRGVDQDEQARAYRVTLAEYKKRSWLRGAFLWRWSVEPEDAYFDYDHYTPYKKPAEIEIRNAWAR